MSHYGRLSFNIFQDIRRFFAPSKAAVHQAGPNLSALTNDVKKKKIKSVSPEEDVKKKKNITKVTDINTRSHLDALHLFASKDHLKQQVIHSCDRPTCVVPPRTSQEPGVTLTDMKLKPFQAPL